MSQHKYRTTTSKGTFVEVQMGWDRPLQQYNCVVSPLNDTDLGDPLYSNLDDEGNANGQSVVYFLEILADRYGISLPNDMIAAVYEDRAQNRVNRVVHY